MCRNVFSRMLAQWMILGIMLSTANTQHSDAQQSDAAPSALRSPGFTALIDSAMRCSHAGMHAAGLAILDQAAELSATEPDAADASAQRHVILSGLRASMLSNLGLLAEAESRFRSIENDLKTIPYAPYGACLRAHLAMHDYRMGRHEEAFNLITAAVRLKGDAAQCRAEASGFYHLATLYVWEGNHAEAREMFAMAARTIKLLPHPGAAGACYWAASAEAFSDAGEDVEADEAYGRAYRYAISDAISTGRCAATIAMRHAELLLRMGETAKAEDMLRRAARHADPGACPALLGGIEEVRARLAFRTDAVESAQHVLAGALWHYFRGLTQEHCTLTPAECVIMRTGAQRAVDRAFASLMHDGARDALLAPAAWNTHLALRAFRGLPRCRHTADPGAEAHTWLQRRLANEFRCVAGTTADTVPVPTGPTLRLLQRRLQREASAIVIRRFLDRTQDPPRSCYAAVLLENASAVIPRMFWLDAAGVFDRTVVPSYLNQFADARELWNSVGPQLQANAVSILPQDETIWERCVSPLLRRLPEHGPLYLLPDGLYRHLNPTAMYDPAGGDYLTDRLRMHMIHTVGTGAVEAPRDDFTASVLVEDVPGELRVAMPAVGRRAYSASAREMFAGSHAGSRGGPSSATRRAENAPTTSIEDTAVQHIDPSVSEADLRARKLGRIFVLDLPTVLLPDAEAVPVRFFLPWVPAGDDPYIRAGVLLADAPSAEDLFSRHQVMCGENDGVLLADEIASMDLRFRQCVLLPRCDLLGEDSVPHASSAALLHSFFHAGAPAVLHTLWLLPPEVRAQFLRRFIDEYDGLNLDEAFRAARRVIRDRWPHPFFWGAFQLTRGEISSH